MSRSILDKVTQNICFVLVSPQIPENIGLVCRVLKNTGFSNLCLVSPNLTPKSWEVAKRAGDILEKAKVVSHLKEAVASSHFVIGTTHRIREYRVIINIKHTIPFVLALAKRKKVSILFGRENFGLFKEETALCDSLVYLPANPAFPSYNLAFSVGITSYEFFTYIEKMKGITSLDLAERREIESLFVFIREGLIQLGWEKEKIASTIFSLKRLFLRTHLTKSEVRLLKNIFLKINKKRQCQNHLMK